MEMKMPINRQIISLSDFPIPETTDIEVQVIADATSNPEYFESYGKIVSSDCFEDETIRKTWDHLCQAYQSGEALSLLTLRGIAPPLLLDRVAACPPSSPMEGVSHCHTLAKVHRERDVYSASLRMLIKASSHELGPDDATEVENLQKAFVTCPAVDWKATIFDYKASITEPLQLLSCFGTPIVTRENLTVICGKPKVCKTTLQSAMVASCLSGASILNIEPSSPFLKVMVCDTEQSPYYLSKQCDRVFRLAGIEKENAKEDDVVFLNLRPYDPDERFSLVVKAVEDFKPDLLFIDGSADLLWDTNDLQSSDRLVSNLLRLSSKYDVGIVTIVHSNPSGDGKVRGHLGSCLERKAETVISLKREGTENTIRIEPRETRDKPFPAFKIRLNQMGDPELITENQSPQTVEEFLCSLMEPGKDYSHSDLITMLEQKGISKGTAKSAISRSCVKGCIIKNINSYSVASTIHQR